MNRISVEFLTRSGCHLCQVAAPGVRRAARWSGSDMVVRDIDAADDLLRDFGLRIPVVRVDGAVVAEGSIQPGLLWFRLMRKRLSRGGS